ncbi:MAG: aspartate ammonia-lyase, partial [Candidatus Aminicenantales bacterium]
NHPFRVERDSLGEVPVPEGAYYGAQTVRASENFPISGLKLHPWMIRAMALIKKAAARANAEMKLLDRRTSRAIIAACDEILSGKFHDQFIVDVFQMGAGTSFHMNCNEVLANRAEEILGGRKGQYALVHPNDHVNIGQSTNDVFPASMKISTLILLKDLMVSIEELEDSFMRKAEEFDPILKSGRTHLQDAAPIRLGQEFRGYAMTIKKSREFVEKASASLFELGLGGSAVGTGLNTPEGFGEKVVTYLGDWTGLALRVAGDLREAMQSMRPMAEVSGALRTLALELNRIANDLRLMASGPRTGLAEIVLPGVAPGSSIMPGKVNPSMLEMLNMVCYQVIGCDLAVSAAVQAGQLELNVMMPVIAFNACFMIHILTNALQRVKSRCIDGIQANPERCRDYAEKSLGLAAALSPHIGYEKAAEVAAQALEEGKSLKEVLRERNLLSSEQVRDLLRPEVMTEPFPVKKGESDPEA